MSKPRNIDKRIKCNKCGKTRLGNIINEIASEFGLDADILRSDLKELIRIKDETDRKNREKSIHDIIHAKVKLGLNPDGFSGILSGMNGIRIVNKTEVPASVNVEFIK